MLLTEEVEIKLTNKKVEYYKNLGYEIIYEMSKRGQQVVKQNQLLTVKIEDLSCGSQIKVLYQCDCCGKIVRSKYQNYTNSIKKHGKYYCNKCATKLFTGNGTATTKLKSSISFAQYLIDKFGDNAIQLYWSDKNIIDPYCISYCSNKKVWIKCQEKDYHCDYEISCNNFYHGKRCPYCHSFKVHYLDSVGYNYPELFEEYDSDNKKSLYELSISSAYRAKWICKECGYKWNALIITRTKMGCGCPECSKSHGEKKIKNVFEQRNIYYIPQKMYDDLLGLGNGNLSYDFYLPTYNLLIEYQGEFHDGTAYQQSKEDYIKQIEHDKRKREYAKNHNINLLEIWYWDFDKIEEILKEKLKINK